MRKAVLAACLIGFAVMPALAQDAAATRECTLDTSKVQDVLRTCDMTQDQIQAVLAEVKNVAEESNVTVREARKLIKAMAKQKAQYMRAGNSRDLMDDDMVAALREMKQAMNQGLTQEEARAAVALCANTCLRDGTIGSEFASRLQTKVSATVQTKLQTRASGDSKELKAQKKIQSAIKERTGECAAPSVTPVKEEVRKNRK